MTEENIDRRVQRTRDLLRRSLMQLIREKSYDDVTIQDITERVNLGRTTFYLHYQSKDDLLLDHHADFMAHLKLKRISRDELLAETPPPELVNFLQQMYDGKNLYLAITHARDAVLIRRGIHEQMVTNLRESLNIAFPDAAPAMPLDVLTNYIIGAHLSLVDWWITTRTAYNAEQIAARLHSLRRAVLCDAYEVES